MLILKLLWFFGFSLFFTQHSAAMPTVISLNDTVKLNGGLAGEYGNLLKALVAINEQRIDTIKKLNVLHEVPGRGTLRSGTEVYAVWKIKGKPAWLEELLEEKYRNDITYSDNKKIILLESKKHGGKKENILKYWSEQDETKQFEVKNDVNLIAVLIIEDKQDDYKSSPLEFWIDSKKSLSNDINVKLDDGSKFKSNNDKSQMWRGSKETKSLENVDSDDLLLKKSKSGSKRLIEFWDPQEVTSNEEENDFSDDGLIKKIQSQSASSEELEGGSKMKFLKTSLERIQNKNVKRNVNIKTNVLDKTYILQKSFKTTEIKKIKNKESSLEYWEDPGGILTDGNAQENKLSGRRKTIYIYSKSCSKKSVKYCNKACNEAFSYMCGKFMCTSQVIKNYREECKDACRAEFMGKNKLTNCKDEESEESE